jgi:photosystem II stability/assembly factor-like uncharacterized protein
MARRSALGFRAVVKRLLLLLGLVLVVATSAAFTAKHGESFSWVVTPTGTTAHFRGLSAVSEKVAWVSGYTATDGVVLRTTDGGKTWQSVGPPGAAGLQFRDIEAFDENHAVIVSIGNNTTDFRVYVTSDGGAHWTQTFTNAEPAAFYDCMTFFDRQHGLVVSDPVNGNFRLISTNDGGMTWQIVSQDGMPPALPGEAAFAASGECLTSHGQRAWFGSGGGAQARVFSSKDGGKTWQVSATPIPSGPTSGVNGIAFHDAKHGIAVGGDFAAPTASPNAVAITSDGGRTWRLAASAPTEYRSGVDWLRGHTAIDVGLSGSDYSTDGGNTWTTFDKGSFDTVDCVHKTCWASGANGRVGYLAQSK